MKQYDPIGFRISETAMYIKKFIDINAQKEGLSSTELKIFKFLSFNKDKDITQNDKIFGSLKKITVLNLYAIKNTASKCIGEKLQS